MSAKNFSSNQTHMRIAFATAMAFIFLITLFPAPAGANQLVDRIVAIVNSNIITLRQLDTAFKPYAQHIRNQGYSPEKEKEELYKARNKLLNEMIDDKLADEEIKKEGIDVSKAEVDDAIEQIKKNNYYTDEDLRHALQMQGLTMKEYRSEIKKQIERSRLVAMKVKSSIVVTDSDIKAYYQAHQKQYGGQEKYKLCNIFMSVPDYSDAQGTEKIHQKMLTVLKQLKQGAAFPELAEKYSEGSNAKDGGKLGEFSIEDISKNLRPVIEKLKPGQFSDVIRTAKGFQIFYLEKIVKTPPQSLQKVSAEIRKKLYNKEVNQKFKSWLQSLRENAHIKIIR